MVPHQLPPGPLIHPPFAGAGSLCSGRSSAHQGAGWSPAGCAELTGLPWGAAGLLEPVMGYILEDAPTKVGCRTARTPKDAAAPVPGDAVLLELAGAPGSCGACTHRLVLGLRDPPPRPGGVRSGRLHSGGRSCRLAPGSRFPPVSMWDGSGNLKGLGGCPRTWHLQDLGIWESGT